MNPPRKPAEAGWTAGVPRNTWGSAGASCSTLCRPAAVVTLRGEEPNDAERRPHRRGESLSRESRPIAAALCAGASGGRRARGGLRPGCREGGAGAGGVRLRPGFHRHRRDVRRGRARRHRRDHADPRDPACRQAALPPPRALRHREAAGQRARRGAGHRRRGRGDGLPGDGVDEPTLRPCCPTGDGLAGRQRPDPRHPRRPAPPSSATTAPRTSSSGARPSICST